MKYKARPGIIGHSPQSLTEHITRVVKRAQMNARHGDRNALQYENIAMLCGYVHDLGKATKKWQDYCPDVQSEIDDENKQKIDHATIGSIWLSTRYKVDQPLHEIVSLVSISHHSGLMNTHLSLGSFLEKRIKDYQDRNTTDGELKEIDEYVRVSNLKPKIDQVYENSISEIRNFIGLKFSTSNELKFSMFMLIKMLFSCLVDADQQDAYNFQRRCLRKVHSYRTDSKYKDIHENRIKHPTKGLLDKLNTFYDNNITPKINTNPINIMRNEYRQIAIEMALKRKGFFRAFGPTGIGKHWSIMNFSLVHSLTHKMNRIFIVSPFESIIEQNAELASNLFDTESKQAVLEIHSTFDYNGKTKKQQRIYRLTKENHDCAIIYTSFVRIFDCFLKNKSIPNRIINSLANSVIVLDECQELYVKFLKFECNILNILVEQYGCTIVLCSATIPSIHHDNYIHTRNEIIDFIPDPIEFESRLNKLRVINQHIEHTTELSVSELGDRLIQTTYDNTNALCILATRRAVQSIYNYVSVNSNDIDAIHLSTYMCPVHRKDVINKIRENIKINRNTCVICTKLIEAGVDVDFKNTFKTIASVPSVIQAMGRCNRNGNDIGEFHLIRLDESIETINSMAELNREKNITNTLLNKSDIELNYELSVKFSDRLLDEFTAISNVDLTDVNNVFSRLSESNVTDYNRKLTTLPFNFPCKDIGGINLIENVQIHLIVPYNDEAIALIEFLKTNPPESYHYRLIQKYTVCVYDNDYHKYENYITTISYSDGIDVSEQGEHSEYVFRFVDPVAYSNVFGLHIQELDTIV